ncbi:hypothetical protein FRC07_013911 [Ceratobasidium sp. 392]|nr:hypothetical protein FRC07_013911 [Ceratobasidium sp. 392]
MSMSNIVPATSAESGSVQPRGMSLVYQLLMPRPTLFVAKSLTTHIKQKDTRKHKMTGAARISNEKRFVKGLGYIRADATPYRPKSLKRASSTSTQSQANMEDLERVCAAMITHKVVCGEPELTMQA